MMKKLDFLFFDAGGGHRAAAHALLQVIERQARPLEIRMVNVQERLDSLDVFRKLTGLRLQDIYNTLLKKGWTLGSAQLMVGMHLVIRMYHGKLVRALEAFWRESRPDLAVSLVPNFNRALRESLGRALPGVPYVTIITDIADYPPHFWIEKQKQYLICGSGRAVEQALGLGHAESMVFRTSGMILNPRFYDTAPLSEEERREARRALGFDAGLPVGLVLFGGQGSSAMLDIARRLDNRQLLLICGHNDKLRARLQALPRRAAAAMRLPVIVEKNAWTLPQERYNAEWVREQGLGLVLPNFRGIAGAVDELLSPERFAGFRSAAARQNNRAVFEIPDMLERILRESEAERP